MTTSTTHRTQYTSHDRAYPAQIFNRMIFFNTNSKATGVGRNHQIRAIYESGERAASWNDMQLSRNGTVRFINGRWTHVAHTGSELPRHNMIGMELIRKNPQPEDEALFTVYIDGYAVYRQADMRYFFSTYSIFEQVDDDIMAHFDIIETGERDMYNERQSEEMLLRRKPLCPRFLDRVLVHKNIGDLLVSKYNNRPQEVANAL